MTPAEIRDALEHADVVFGALEDGISVQDETGAIVYVNDAAARICTFPDAKTMRVTPTAEIFGRFEVLDADGRPVASPDLPGRRALANELPEPMLLRVRHRQTGETWWSLVRAKAVRDDTGKPRFAITMWHDVTREEKARAAQRLLAEVSAQLGRSLDQVETLGAVARALVPDLADYCIVDLVEKDAPETIAVAHADPAKVELVRAYRARHPTDWSATFGPPNVLRTGKPELHPKITPEMLRARTRTQEQYEEVIALGAFESALVVPIVVRGVPEGVITLVTAASWRRYDEADLEVALEIGRRAGQAIENARAYRTAQNAIRTRDIFLAVAGHELRTPLATLLLQLEALATSAHTAARDPTQLSERVEKIYEQAERLTRRLDALLDVSRIAEGKLDLALRDADLAEVVRDVTESLAESAAQRGCELRLESAGPCRGRWDIARLEQVVTNLVSNAVRYGAGKPVSVGAETRGDDVVLRVSDAGIGIADEDRGRIFERFERGRSESSHGGLGLGLWIAREIVTQHGGTIDVASVLGEGTTFTVTLPRVPAATA